MPDSNQDAQHWKSRGSSPKDSVWTNWSHSQSATGISIESPSSTDEIAHVVSQASNGGRRVRPIGSSHSFTAIGQPTDIQLNLNNYSSLISLDRDTGLVKVKAGMTLGRLNRSLWDAELALPNLGDIDVQTVAGAISTGTHGTGRGFGGLATLVRGFELVTSNGEVLECSPTSNSEIFDLGRISLGALGVITSYTLQTVPAFLLRALEGPLPFGEAIENFSTLMTEHDHFEFFWFPYSELTTAKRNTRLELNSELHERSKLKKWIDNTVLSNGGFAAMQSIGRRSPRVIPYFNRFAAKTMGSGSFTERSYNVFASKRSVRFVEMEYNVPFGVAPTVIKEVARLIELNDWSVSFPIEVRSSAPDDIPLSTAYDRDSAYIAVHLEYKRDPNQFFRAIESLMSDFEGRPHWGKMHFLGADELRNRYPRFDEFVALRNKLDPSGTFTNPYLDRVLGSLPL